MDTWDYVIVGGGIAGVSAALEIRRLAPGQRVLIISKEPHLPYKRTKLSKQLFNRVSVEELYLQPSGFWDDSQIDIMPGAEVVKVDPISNTVTVDDDEVIGWGKLLFATGSSPSYPANLSRHDVSDSLVFRNWNDMETLYVRAQKAQNILVSGMGILGIELADQLIRMGKTVTLMGSSPQLMYKYLSPRAAELLEESLVKRGVKLRYLDEILSFSRRNSTLLVTTVHEQLPFDLLVFCTGSKPETKIADSAGIFCKNGILVDEKLRTNKPNIFAAGDTAEHPGGHISQLWHESEDQGLTAGRIMTGSTETWKNSGFRMKCEVFDVYAFSLVKPGVDCSIPQLELEKNGKYISLYGESERCTGIVMVNDKEHAPLFQQAVREGWPHSRVLSVFG